MMTLCHGNAFLITGPLWRNQSVIGGFPFQRDNTWRFGIFFPVRRKKLLGRQLNCRWYERRHCANVTSVQLYYLNASSSFSFPSFSADTDQNARMADVAVTSAGTVFWITHHKYESACLVDLKFYPFDEQACDLWFQSLSETSNDLVLDIYPPGFDLETQLSGFREADEWEVIQNTSEVIRRPRDEGELLVFSRRRSLRLRLVLRRRVGFNAYLQSVPCVVLSSMTIMVFVLPQERPDRHIIGEKTSQNWNRIDPMLHGSIGSILFQSWLITACLLWHNIIKYGCKCELNTYRNSRDIRNSLSFRTLSTCYHDVWITSVVIT